MTTTAAVGARPSGQCISTEAATGRREHVLEASREGPVRRAMRDEARSLTRKAGRRRDTDWARVVFAREPTGKPAKQTTAGDGRQGRERTAGMRRGGEQQPGSVRIDNLGAAAPSRALRTLWPGGDDASDMAIANDVSDERTGRSSAWPSDRCQRLQRGFPDRHFPTRTAGTDHNDSLWQTSGAGSGSDSTAG